MKLTKHQEFLGGRSACVSCIIGRRRDHWQLDARRVARAWLQSARKLSIRCCMPRAQGLPQNQDRGRGPRGAPSLLGDLTTTRCAQGRTCMQLCRRAVRGTWLEVLAVFFRLVLTSFGGPIAHLGYFREVVTKRRWLDDRTYADIIALCQFLRGPASSQVGIAVGLSRAGYAGDPVATCARRQNQPTVE